MIWHAFSAQTKHIRANWILNMSLAPKLEQIHRLTHRFWMKNTNSLGLSYSEFEYLSAVYEQAVLSEQDDFHGQHLHDIVTAMGVNKASASAMMDKLEKRKLIRVKPCKRDARAKHFILSKKGEELRQQGQAAYVRMADELEDKLASLFTIATDTQHQAIPANSAEQTEFVEPPKKPRKQTTAKPKAEKQKRVEKPKDPEALPQLSLFG